MKKTDYPKYQALLEADRDQLIASLQKVAFIDDENPSDWVPRRENLNVADGEAVEELELAEEIEKFENNTATVKELESRLNEILAALQRIEDGTYGIDEVSGEELTAERLAANPAARSSVENAPKLEQEASTQNEID